MSEAFEEESVDEELLENLQKPIKTKKRTYQQVHEEDEEEEEEDEDAQKPCSKKTRDKIYQIWTQAWEERGAELLPLVQKLSTMSEAEAKAYLACLQACHSRSIHQHISAKILEAGSVLLCHPNDALTPLAMQEDDYLKSGISLLVSDCLSFLGRMGFAALLLAYAGASRYTHRETRSKPVIEKTGIATETVSTDGLRQGGDGEDNVNDQVND